MTGLSEKQSNLLLMAVKKNNGVITLSFAERMYSGKSSAKSAIQTFELHDLVERTAPGTWKIVKLPEDVKKQLRNMQNEKSKEEEYDKEPVEN